METFYAYSLSARAPLLETHSTQEGSEPVPEKPTLEMQDYDRLSQRESKESMITLPEAEKHPEKKGGSDKAIQELAKPERGFRRLLWHLVETIISKEMVLRQEYRRRAAEEVFGLRGEELRTLIGRLEIILWRALKVIITPIFRLALSEYKESVSKLLNQGNGETNETTQQEHVDEAVPSVTNMTELDYQSPQEKQ